MTKFQETTLKFSYFFIFNILLFSLFAEAEENTDLTFSTFESSLEIKTFSKNTNPSFVNPFMEDTIFLFKGAAAKALSNNLLDEWISNNSESNGSNTTSRYKITDHFLCIEKEIPVNVKVWFNDDSNFECLFLLDNSSNLRNIKEDYKTLLLPQLLLKSKPGVLDFKPSQIKISVSNQALLGSKFIKFQLISNFNRLQNLYNKTSGAEKKIFSKNILSTFSTNAIKYSTHLKLMNELNFNGESKAQNFYFQTSQNGVPYLPDFQIENTKNLFIDSKAYLLSEEKDKRIYYSLNDFIDWIKNNYSNGSVFVQLKQDVVPPVDPNKHHGGMFFYEFTNALDEMITAEDVIDVENLMAQTHCTIVFNEKFKFSKDDYFQMRFANVFKLNNSRWGTSLLLSLSLIQVKKNSSGKFENIPQLNQVNYHCYVEEKYFTNPDKIYHEAMFGLFFTHLFKPIN